MKRIRRVILLALTLLAVASPVAAQDAVELDATIGLHGYVVPYEPSTVSVQVHADVLFVGDLQTTAGGVSLFTPIEVPAGSTKQYTVEIPAVGPTNRVTVRLFVDGADEHLAQESVNVLFPGEKPLVGLLNASGIEGDLAEVRSIPFGKDLAILNLTDGDLDGDISPLGYLVAGRGAFDAATPDAIDAVNTWVESGGRLVGEAHEVARIGPGEGISITEEASSAPLGAGELITVDDIAAVSAWSPAIRDIPPLTFSSVNSDFAREVGFQLFQAAAAAGDSATPGIPWLFGALTVYVILVGPVNFFVLRRLKRRELAWVTIPAVSLLMLIVLWTAGRTQVDSRIVTHASVVVQEGNTSRATSAMIVVAGAGGEHSVDAPSGWSLAPVDASMMFGRASGVEARVGPGDAGGTRLTFDMPDLGAATLQAVWSPDPVAVTADLVADGDDLKLTVANHSPFEFWAWGIGTSSSARAANGALGLEQTDSLTLRVTGVGPTGGSPIGDAVSRGDWGWDEEPWETVWPLAETAGRQEGATLRAGPYFFGYTDDLATDVLVDGHIEHAQGPALVIIPLDPPDGVVLRRGVAEVIQVVGADFVDSYPGSLYASGADALELRFYVAPNSEGQARVNNQFANLPGVASFEVYNWQSREFDEYSWLKEFPLSGHVSPTGDLMTRISFEQTQFSDMNLPDNSLTLSMVSP
jgi:hypothetical protein